MTGDVSQSETSKFCEKKTSDLKNTSKLCNNCTIFSVGLLQYKIKCNFPENIKAFKYHWGNNNCEKFWQDGFS